jgi:hypothetical protein
MLITLIIFMLSVAILSSTMPSVIYAQCFFVKMSVFITLNMQCVIIISVIRLSLAYSNCHFFIVLLSIVMLSVLLSIVMLSVLCCVVYTECHFFIVMLNDAMLSVIILCFS